MTAENVGNFPPFRHYIDELTEIPPQFSELLQSYSDIPVEEHREHVKKIRDRAFEHHPYPCLGRFRFLDLFLSNHPRYQSDVLHLLKVPAKGASESEAKPDPLFLDIGCCVGQDLRKLAFDGVPVSCLYGADLNPGFISIGYELFKDEHKFPKDHFFAPANALDNEETNPLRALEGKVTILHLSAVFHLFNRDDQMRLGKNCIKLLHGSENKTLILGGDLANVNAGEYMRSNGQTRFSHNTESWAQFWDDVSRDSNCRVETHFEMRQIKRPTSPDDAEKSAVEQVQHLGVGGREMQGLRWGHWWVWVDFGNARGEI